MAASCPMRTMSSRLPDTLELVRGHQGHLMEENRPACRLGSCSVGEMRQASITVMRLVPTGPVAGPAGRDGGKDRDR